MSENLRYWNSLKRPPVSALKPITAGRLKGKTDVNPQWRIQAMTELFGPLGFGWYYSVDREWLENGHNDQICANVRISLYVRDGDKWSAPIPGIGGSMLVVKEKEGHHTNDEAYKMALTDALSVAMKGLGVAADIYAGLWDGSKYIDREPEKPKKIDASQITQRVDGLIKDIQATPDKASFDMIWGGSQELREEVKAFADKAVAKALWEHLATQQQNKRHHSSSKISLTNKDYRMNIYIDIETVPSQDPAVRAELSAEITAPGNYKKAESIAEWERDQKPALVEEAWRKTSFDGARGQIVCISIAKDDDAPIVLFDEDWLGSERGIISGTFDLIDSLFDASQDKRPVFIGHNVASFDLRFLFQRAVISAIKPSSIIPFHAKPWDPQVYDTMIAWAGVGNRVSLDKLCKALGIAGKGSELGGEEIDGSKVWDFVKAGRIADVAKYCAGDVERVRAVHKRLTFAS